MPKARKIRLPASVPMPMSSKAIEPVAPRWATMPAISRHSGGHLHDQIAHAGAIGAFAASGPDQEHRGDRRALPEDEQRDEVAGEHRRHRASGVDQRRDVLQRVFEVAGVKQAEKGGDQEDGAEGRTQPVDPQGDEGEIEHPDPAELALGQAHEIGEGHDRQRQHVDGAQPAGEQRHQCRAQDEDQAG
jgi:hypothetical protein